MAVSKGSLLPPRRRRIFPCWCLPEQCRCRAGEGEGVRPDGSGHRHQVAEQGRQACQPVGRQAWCGSSRDVLVGGFSRTEKGKGGDDSDRWRCPEPVRQGMQSRLDIGGLAFQGDLGGGFAGTGGGTSSGASGGRDRNKVLDRAITTAITLTKLLTVDQAYCHELHGAATSRILHQDPHKHEVHCSRERSRAALSLADSCFPINQGLVASRLHEFFLHQFCDAHSCNRGTKHFPKGGREQTNRFYLALCILTLILLPLFYLIVFLHQREMKKGAQDLRRFSKIGQKKKPS